MRRILILGLGLVGGAGLLSGCSDELPTTVGADIIEPGFRTFDVVLDAATFLQGDTTYDRLGELRAVPFRLVAEAFEEELFAHTLFRVNVPTRVSFDDEGTDVVDSVFTIVGGTVTLVLDSLSEETGPVTLELMQLVESWDPGSVSWEERFDTAGVAADWAEPGGTIGQRLGSTTWTSGDTVQIPLDSTAAAVLSDSAGAFHGALIRSATPDTRLRIESVRFDFDARPSTADTIVAAGSVGQNAVVVTPEASAAATDEMRVGGVPTWRTALHFRSLSDVEIPCTPESTTCTVPLSRVSVNVATLLLQPQPVGARRIERPFRIEARAVLRAPGVPVSRSPLSASLGAMEESLAPSDFLLDAGPLQATRVPVTGYVQRNLEPLDEEDPILWVALVAAGEQQAPVFGYAAFGSIQSVDPPRLRLVVTVPAVEEQQ